jgi:hypothetical protein
MTFDVKSQCYIGSAYGWQSGFEVFSVCRKCKRSTTFVVHLNNGIYSNIFSEHKQLTDTDGALNEFFDVKEFISLRHLGSRPSPEYLPQEIEESFAEAASCLSIGCWNAAGAMFRMCIDRATRSMLPEEALPGLNSKTRKDLGLRLPWLFATGLLPESLRELSSCIREDGNDGVHAGNLGPEDAEDLYDFTFALLERIYSEPEKLRLAKVRREVRRNTPPSP